MRLLLCDLRHGARRILMVLEGGGQQQRNQDTYEIKHWKTAFWAGGCICEAMPYHLSSHSTTHAIFQHSAHFCSLLLNAHHWDLERINVFLRNWRLNLVLRVWMGKFLASNRKHVVTHCKCHVLRSCNSRILFVDHCIKRNVTFYVMYKGIFS